MSDECVACRLEVEASNPGAYRIIAAVMLVYEIAFKIDRLPDATACARAAQTYATLQDCYDLPFWREASICRHYHTHGVLFMTASDRREITDEMHTKIVQKVRSITEVLGGQNACAHITHNICYVTYTIPNSRRIYQHIMSVGAIGEICSLEELGTPLRLLADGIRRVISQQQETNSTAAATSSQILAELGLSTEQ